jgi:hypothetical protein
VCPNTTEKFDNPLLDEQPSQRPGDFGAIDFIFILPIFHRSIPSQVSLSN